AAESRAGRRSTPPNRTAAGTTSRSIRRARPRRPNDNRRSAHSLRSWKPSPRLKDSTVRGRRGRDRLRRRLFSGEPHSAASVMVPDPAASEQPSVTSAVERVLSAGQQLLVDRLDLLLLEAKEGMSRGIEAAAVAGLAVGVFFCGWLCINASLAVFFQATA